MSALVAAGFSESVRFVTLKSLRYSEIASKLPATFCSSGTSLSMRSVGAGVTNGLSGWSLGAARSEVRPEGVGSVDRGGFLGAVEERWRPRLSRLVTASSGRVLASCKSRVVRTSWT